MLVLLLVVAVVVVVVAAMAVAHDDDGNGFRFSQLDVLAPMRQDPKMEGIYIHTYTYANTPHHCSPCTLNHKSDSAHGATDLTGFQAYRGWPKV